MLEIEAGFGNGKFRVTTVTSYEQMLEIEAGLDTGKSLALVVKTGSDEFSFESIINAEQYSSAGACGGINILVD